LPTWIGDSVMVSPAIENLRRNIPNPAITFIGPSSSVILFQDAPDFVKAIEIKKTYKDFLILSRQLESFDLFISFRSSLRSKIFSLFIKAKVKHFFSKRKFHGIHQVEKYNSFINEILSITSKPDRLKIYHKIKKKESKKVVIINPGASFGPAKRWDAKGFAKVAEYLSPNYDVLITGNKDDEMISNEITQYLSENKISNYKDLTGKTSLKELLEVIANSNLFITGDSGPMHIAAAFQIPSINIFGPTRVNETCQWLNKISVDIYTNLDCQPCMQRNCPLNHHNCMKLIKSDDVIRKINEYSLEVGR